MALLERPICRILFQLLLLSCSFIGTRAFSEPYGTPKPFDHSGGLFAPCTTADRTFRELHDLRPLQLSPAITWDNFETSLPVIVVNPMGNNPFCNEYVQGTISVVNMSTEGQPRYLETHAAEFRLAGQSSRGFPKKQFNVKMMASNYTSKEDISLLGMVPQSKYRLNAPYHDRSALINAVGLELARQANVSSWTPHWRHCYVFLVAPEKGHLALGIYLLLERIDIAEGKLELADKNCETKPDCGFLLSVDKPTKPGPRWDDRMITSCRKETRTSILSMEYPSSKAAKTFVTEYLNRACDVAVDYVMGDVSQVCVHDSNFVLCHIVTYGELCF